MKISLALHIFGIIFWMGALILLPSLLKSGASDEGVHRYVSKTTKGFLLPGFAIVLLTGLHQIGVRGMSYYFSQGWFHAKLTLVFFLIVLTVLLWREVSKFKDGKSLSRPILVLVHAGGSASALLIALLTFRVLL